MRLAPRSRHELANSVRWVGRAVGCLQREAFIVLVVRIDHDLRTGGVQVVPQRFHRRVALSGAPREEARVMPVGNRAARRARGEIAAEPLLLRRACGGRDAAVQHHDVPVAQVVAVVALAGCPGRRAEIVEIRLRAALLVLDLARRRAGARLVAAPGGVVALVEPILGAVVVREVAGGEDRARDPIEQRGGRRVVAVPAGRDVARADQYLPAAERERQVGAHGRAWRCGLGVGATGSQQECGG